jgi:hypothetical protein
MKYLIIALLLTGCNIPKTKYVDRVVKVGQCPSEVGLPIEKPTPLLMEGSRATKPNVENLVEMVDRLKRYAETLSLENKRLNDAIKRCKEGEK